MGAPSVSRQINRELATRSNQGQAVEGNCNSQSTERRNDITGKGYWRQGITRVNKKGSGSQSL